MAHSDIKVFSVDQLKLNGDLLSGNSLTTPAELYYDGVKLAAGATAAENSLKIGAGSGLMFGNDPVAEDGALNNDFSLDVSGGPGITVDADSVYLGNNAIVSSMVTNGNISNIKLATHGGLAGGEFSLGGEVIALGGSFPEMADVNLKAATGYLSASLIGDVTDAQLAQDYVRVNEIDGLTLFWDTSASAPVIEVAEADAQGRGLDSKHYRNGSVDDVHLASDYIQTSEVDASSIEWTTAGAAGSLNVKNLGITNAMLAGHAGAEVGIANTKLANSSMVLGGQTFSLGHIETTHPGMKDVDVSGATGYRSDKLVGLIGVGPQGAPSSAGLTNQLEANYVSIGAGDGLKNGGSISLGGALTLNADIDGSTITLTSTTKKLQVGTVAKANVGFNFAGSTSKGGVATGLAGLVREGTVASNAGGGIDIKNSAGASVTFDGSTDAYFHVDDTVVRTAGDQSIGGLKTFTNHVTTASNVNLTVGGNLTVAGNTVSVTSNEVNIGDSIIVLNASFAGSVPTSDGGFEIERGNVEINASFIWNETNDWWSAGLSGFEQRLWTMGEARSWKVAIPKNSGELNYIFKEANGTTVFEFDSIPKVSVTLENTGEANPELLSVLVTGVTTSGVGISLSSHVDTEFYHAILSVSVI